MNPELVEFTLDLDGEDVVFKLHYLNKKSCAKLSYDYMQLLVECARDQRLPKFDEIEPYALRLFAKGFAIYRGESTELSNLEFFWDKSDMLVNSITEAMRGNVPDFFTRWEKSFKG